MNFYERLSSYRNDQGISREELAQKIGVTYQEIIRWEAGVEEPDCSSLVKLADVFNITLDELCGRKNTNMFSDQSDYSKKRKIKYAIIAIIAVVIFIGGYVTGAGFKLYKEKVIPDIPDTISVSGVSFSYQPDGVRYEFIPSVIGESYSYKICFRDFGGDETSFDVSFSDSGCHGTAQLASKNIASVTIIVGNGKESRALLIASNLNIDEKNMSWKKPD